MFAYEAAAPVGIYSYDHAYGGLQIPNGDGALALHVMPRYILHNNLQEGVQYKQQVAPPPSNTDCTTFGTRLCCSCGSTIASLLVVSQVIASVGIILIARPFS